MIYLQNIRTPQVLFVPKSGETPSGELVFKAKSTIDLDTKIEQAVSDLGTSKLYFNLAVSVPENIPNGEYEYTLEASGQVLSSGILIVGDIPALSYEYEKSITYEQYESSE